MFNRPSTWVGGLALLLSLSACVNVPSRESSAPAPAMKSGYTCCNLHAEGDWISDSNYATLPMIPAGSAITLKEYGRYRAMVDIDGRAYRLGHDYGRAQESTEQWVGKIIVTDDPRKKLATYPRQVQDAIRAGRVMKGMSKEQVLMAVGYPLTSENPSMNSPTWRMWVSSFGEYQLNWDANGRVRDIVGDPATLNLIVHQP